MCLVSDNRLVRAAYLEVGKAPLPAQAQSVIDSPVGFRIGICGEYWASRLEYGHDEKSVLSVMIWAGVDLDVVKSSFAQSASQDRLGKPAGLLLGQRRP